MTEILVKEKRIGISHWLVTMAIAGLIALGTSRNIFTYAAFLLCVGSIVLYDDDRKLCVVFFTMSFTHIFKSAPGTTSFFMYSFLFYVFWQFIQQKKFRAVVAAIALLTIYVYVVQFVNHTLDLIQTIKFAANLLFLYLALDKIRPEACRDIYLSYIMGVIVASIIKVSGLFPNIELINGGEPYGRFTGLHMDPNYYSINVIISLCLLIVLVHQKKLKGVFALPMAAMLVYFIGLTSSKSAFLMLLLPIGLFIYSNHVYKRYAAQVVLAVIIVFFVTNLLAGKIPFFNEVLRRLDMAENADEMTSGRTVLWQNYLAYIFSRISRLLFGRGIGAGAVGISIIHNTYIDILYFLGLLGGTAYLLTISSLMRGYAKKRPCLSWNLMNQSVFICIFLMYFFLSELVYFDLPFHLFLAIVVWRDNMDPRDENRIVESGGMKIWCG